MLNKKIKIGSYVKILKGSDKGKIGKVLTLKRKKNILIVKGVNLHSKHLKLSKNEESKIKLIELPINGSIVEVLFS